MTRTALHRSRGRIARSGYASTHAALLEHRAADRSERQLARLLDETRPHYDGAAGLARDTGRVLRVWWTDHVTWDLVPAPPLVTYGGGGWR